MYIVQLGDGGALAGARELRMVKHRIYARHQGVAAEDRLPIPLIKRCVREALRLEGVDLPCEVSALITDDESIRGINREFRGIDEPTDVLSFPMQFFSPPGWDAKRIDMTDPGTDAAMLGDIILSAQRVIEQAGEHSHSIGQETAYLTVHSVLHLLGYDHVDEAEGKRQMRDREKEIMNSVQIGDDER